jgi:hypothetical protein
MKIKIENARLSFPALFRKAVFNGAETKFEATFLIPKKAPVLKKIQSVIAEKLKTELKAANLPAEKICLKDGDNFEYDGYAGHYSIKASNDKRPTVIDRDKTPLSESDDKPYAGCYVNGIIELWAQNNAYGKRINAKLLGVQFSEHGDPFVSGSTVDDDDFEIIEDGEENEFM